MSERSTFMLSDTINASYTKSLLRHCIVIWVNEEALSRYYLVAYEVLSRYHLVAYAISY